MFPDYTKRDLSNLNDMAIDYSSNSWRRQRHRSKFHKCHYIYRNKPKSYYDEVHLKHAGVMHTYLKDPNGDPACPISNKIRGIHFGACVDLTQPPFELPPTESRFGDMGLQIPAATMFHFARNMYFADFYCHTNRHRVTLVMTRPGSHDDHVCKQKLLRLDPHCNDYLQIHPHSREVIVTSGVWLEIFFTEKVSIWPEMYNGAIFKRVLKLGNRQHFKGLPKNHECTICNLDRS